MTRYANTTAVPADRSRAEIERALERDIEARLHAVRIDPERGR